MNNSLSFIDQAKDMANCPFCEKQIVNQKPLIDCLETFGCIDDYENHFRIVGLNKEGHGIARLKIGDALFNFDSRNGHFQAWRNQEAFREEMDAMRKHSIGLLNGSIKEAKAFQRNISILSFITIQELIGYCKNISLFI